MLYGIDEDTSGEGQKFAVLSCRKCEYKEAVTRENPVVYEHLLREDKSDRLAANPYLKHDPTLPRFTELVCPNNECPTKQGATPDVVGVKIDTKHLLWMYQCANCDTTWKQAARIQ
jgi:DNA-directed RNA polymerase subunit M/transcription elongation factor TFIIS